MEYACSDNNNVLVVCVSPRRPFYACVYVYGDDDRVYYDDDRVYYDDALDARKHQR